jgi:hypothetical protein
MKHLEVGVMHDAHLGNEKYVRKFGWNITMGETTYGT